MRLEELIRHYVAPIKRFEGTLGGNYTAEDIYNYYKQQATFYEIESFTRVRFTRKFKEVAQTREQQDWLNEKAKEIASLAQRMFEKKYTQFYQTQ